MATFHYWKAQLSENGSTAEHAFIVRSDAFGMYTYFLVSNDGTIPTNGGFPYGLRTSIPSERLCSWNLGEYESCRKAVATFNEHAELQPDAWVGRGIRVDCDFENERTLEDGESLDFSLLPAPHSEVTDRAAAPAAASTATSGLVSDLYETEKLYTGQGGYHSHRGFYINKPKEFAGGHKIGIELEVIGKSSAAQAKINRLRSNYFYQESDGSLDSYGVELITIPLRPEDAKNPDFWRPMCDEVGKNATSWGKSCTGLHVHIGRELLGDNAEQKSETLGKLLYFYHHCVNEDASAMEVNKKIYGRAHTYNEHDGKSPEGNAVKLLGKGVLKEKSVCDKVKDGMLRKSSGDRYFDINIQNAATIEFRKGKGSICAERIAAVVAWSEAMIKYVKATAWTELSFDGLISFIQKDKKGCPDCLRAFMVEDR